MRIALLALFLSATAALAQESPKETAKPVYRVTRLADAIRVDGRLDESTYSAPPTFELAYETRPAENKQAPVRTEVWITYDSSNLYAAFRAHDPDPKLIRARYSDRDNAFNDDFVGIVLDTFHDQRRAFEFFANPLGVQMDLTQNEMTGNEDSSWDAIWDSAGRITASGYEVEMRIPFSSLRFPSGGGEMTWGIDAVRTYPRGQQYRLGLNPLARGNNCYLCQSASLAGIAGVSPARSIELNPTVTASQSGFRNDFPHGSIETEDPNIEAGITGQWGITPNFTFTGTVNPDFSQVEADAAQLDVNTRFALFFPEKRPFFVEGSDFFSTRMQLVFTRTIGDPSAGLKLTGKSGPSTYALLVARDEITNVLIPGDQSSTLGTIPGGSTTAIARYSREFGKRTTLGGLVTSRRGDGYRNLVAAADGFQRLSEKDSLRWQAAHSDDGHAISAGYSHRDQNWSWDARYGELSPEFRADSGFVNQVGVRSASAFAERRLRGGADKWFRNLYFSGGVDGTREFEGAWNEWGADLGVTYQGPRQSEISIGLAPNQEFFAGTTYHDFRYSTFASFQPAPDVALALSVRWGETIDFTNQRQADFITISPSTELTIGRRLRGEIAYDYQVLETKQGNRIYEVHLPQARLLYHFSGRAFVRTIVQYQAVTREPSQYIVPVSRNARELLTQVLFSYRLNAQSVFLAGYSDNYEGANDLTRTNRAVFAKLSYAFLF